MKTRKLTALFLAFAMVLGLVGMVGTFPLPVKAAEENVVIADDFSGETSIFGDNASIANGEATITRENSMFNIKFPEEKMPASNNYVISFDMRYAADSHFFLHLLGLDGSNPDSNIYFHCEANGMYLSMCDFYGHTIYNNSGDDTGGLDYNQVFLTDFAHFEIVHYNGYIELWANGVRRVVSHLSNFGNNRYSTRTEIAEGIITGLGFHAEKANAVVIDNLEVREAVAADASYFADSNETHAGNGRFLPLSARNLDHENFRVTGTFVIADESAADYYPTIKLFGLNASLHHQNARSYGINFQSYMNGLQVQPQIFAQTDDIEWVSGGDASPVTLTSGQELQYQIDVFGDHIQFYINGELKLDTTFTAMGLTKGHLQYIGIFANHGAYWKNVSYVGLDAETGAVVTSDAKSEMMTGSTVTLNATAFGAATDETYEWYVNGEKQTETGKQLVLSNLAEGKYEVVYKSATYTSNVVKFEVLSKKINISADVLEMYPDGTAIFTAELVGDFSADALAWYVNGEKHTDGSEPLTLSGLAAGNYVVTLQAGETVSNILTLVVKPASLEITTSKHIYKQNETAELSAAVVGASAGEIAWFVNGVAAEGNEALTIDMSAYNEGDKIVVTATCGDLTSEEVLLYVSADLLGNITSDETYQEISKMEITEGGDYGTHKVGTDDGNYLYMTDAGGSWTNYTGAMPTQTGFIWEYKVFIPADISGKYYVYPCMTALDSNYASAMMETAIEVSPEGIRPYFKNQGSGSEYLHTEYGLGVDTSYEGVSKLGEWNTITLAVKGTQAAMYINGEQVLFVTIATMGVPGAISINMWPDAGDTIPLKLKDFTVTGTVAPAPDLESVSISVSKVEAKVGEKVKFSANLNPFNAEANEIAWYVNDAKVDGTGMTFEFAAEAEGTYKVHCVIDGITSASKTITVVAENVGGNTTGDPAPSGNNTGLIIGIVAAVVVIGAVVAVIVIKKKK